MLRQLNKFSYGSMAGKWCSWVNIKQGEVMLFHVCLVYYWSAEPALVPGTFCAFYKHLLIVLNQI